MVFRIVQINMVLSVFRLKRFPFIPLLSYNFLVPIRIYFSRQLSILLRKGNVNDTLTFENMSLDEISCPIMVGLTGIRVCIQCYILISIKMQVSPLLTRVLSAVYSCLSLFFKRITIISNAKLRNIVW